jgi:predicted ATP-binding protein involved in virulence
MTHDQKNTPDLSHLKQNARKGNIFSMYELYKQISEPENSAYDIEAANNHLLRIHELLSKNHLKLKFISFYNFKCFKVENEKTVDIDFHENITVIIGNNGSGKTSIVEAIAKGFSWFNNTLMAKSGGSVISNDDINCEAKDYAEIEYKLRTDKISINTVQFSLKKLIKDFSSSSKSELESMRALGEIYKTLSREVNQQTIPLLAVYPVESRSTTDNWKRKGYQLAPPQVSSRFDACEGALTNATSGFYEAYIALSQRSKAEKEQEKTLQTKLNTLKELLDKQTDNPLILSEIKETETRIAEERKNQTQSKKLEHLNSAIKELIGDNIEQIQTLEENQGFVIYATTSFGKVSISQLSHGQKALIALLGDLFFRLEKLNPHLDNPLESPGIVVIDEIELHLHPKWQQKVLIALQKSCPNIQWIITTHSPQVLSTVGNLNIRQIRMDNNVISVETPTFQTKGVSSIDVLEQIMGTHAIPKVEEAEWLSKYRQHIANNQWETPEAIALREQIERHFTTEHPEVNALCSEIEFKKLKNRLKTKKAE